MFFIHGGGYALGEGSHYMYGPGHLLDRDVIMVALHYRVGPMGFLNIGNEMIAGNQGIWDQREGMVK